MDTCDQILHGSFKSQWYWRGELISSKHLDNSIPLLEYFSQEKTRVKDKEKGIWKRRHWYHCGYQNSKSNIPEQYNIPCENQYQDVQDVLN